MANQDRSASPSFANIVGFIAVLMLAWFVLPWVMKPFLPPPQQQANAPANDKKDDNATKKAEAEKKAAEKLAKAQNAGKKPEPKPSEEPVDESAVAGNAAKPAPAAPVKPVPAAPPNNDDRRYLTLGSVDPDLAQNPYRMGATLSRVGGSIVRQELSSEHYRDIDDRSGYLGHLVIDDSDTGPGCLAQVVCPGTPAAKAGLKPGDRIMAVTYKGNTTDIEVPTAPEDSAANAPKHLETVLRQTKPGDEIVVSFHRDGKMSKTTVHLIRRPLEVIRPERRTPEINWVRNGPTDAIHWDENCPPSYLTTLQQVDGDKLRGDENPEAKFETELAEELPGVNLRKALWTIESPKKGVAAESKVVFSCLVPKYNLKITKTYELEKVPAGGDAHSDAPAYHLNLSVEIANNDTKKHDVAYRQDGPNGLPVEGSWYVSGKVNRKWFTIEGLRDVVYQLSGGEVGVVTCSELADTKDRFRREIGEASEFGPHPPRFFGVDAQYFSVAMLPDAKSTAPNIERAIALRVGNIAEERRTLTNTSFRLIGKPIAIEPGKTAETQRYVVFSGPKRQELLRSYELSGLIYYGLSIFRMVAVPLTAVLDSFYSFSHNYGLAIIMLTIVVRLCMFPLSRKSAKSAQIMQKLQPEIKEIQKRYKKDPEALRKAQMELFSKHNYHPAAGCLPMIIQLPVFMGLYRALQVNVELRDSPLISSAVRWCSNLAAPDMLYDWSWFMPKAVNNGIAALYGLGPYLNLFPIITVALYLIQQKVMMPPAVDEQTAVQQKMMKYMMVFVGLMFYKVAAGLCLYFIATTLWSLGERRFLPKKANVDGDEDDAPAVKSKPIKPRLTDSEREAIRRQKRKR